MYNLQKNSIAIFSCILAGFVLDGCGSNSDNDNTQKTQSLSYINVKNIGGESTDTVAMHTQQAFAQPASNLSESSMELHLTGDANFETNFSGTSDSSSFQAGLGPVQNNTNCDKCHPSDGRAHLPYVPHKLFDDTMGSLNDINGYRKLRSSGVFLRISIENEEINKAKKTKNNMWGSPVAVPGFSDQLFNRGSLGLRDYEDGLNSGQADVWMKYENKTFTYPDGESITLSKPILVVDNPYDSPDAPFTYDPIEVSKDSKSRLFKPDVRMGIRIGMPMIGLGLLDNIKEADILALVDVDDKDADGISGKANWVFDKEKYDYCKNPSNKFSCSENPPISLGRYGWKANTPTVAHQSLGALRGDMGITNPLFKKESIQNTPLMKQYRDYAGSSFVIYSDTKNDEDLDANMEQSQSVVFYSETLAVPARRDVDNKEVIEGAKLFKTLSCNKCHTPSYLTGTKSGSYSKMHNRNPYLEKSEEKSRIKELENQSIFPFTDMLLHDMGDDLADGRKDVDANGNEWKTRPLWGIGLTKKVNPVAGFLHDGRAKTIEEAILWHGGESLKSKEDFIKLTKSKRESLIKFLNSL